MLQPDLWAAAEVTAETVRHTADETEGPSARTWVCLTLFLATVFVFHPHLTADVGS